MRIARESSEIYLYASFGNYCQFFVKRIEFSNFRRKHIIGYLLIAQRLSPITFDEIRHIISFSFFYVLFFVQSAQMRYADSNSAEIS